jgi:hypothetical protein
MNPLWPTLVYSLCLAASVLCAVLLLRAWYKVRSRLLFWTALSFVFLALNNLALVADMVIFPIAYLWPLRFIPSFLAVSILLFGFIWESDR